MTFSVVIPAFNAAATIRQTLQSCLAQTWAPLEIIVVDDASDDDTPAIVENFDPRIRLIRFNRNQGVAAARNAGWDQAKGTYVAFLDSDDEWHPDKLKISAHYFRQRPGLMLLYHPYTLTPFRLPQAWDSLHLRRFPFWKFLFTNPLQTSCVCLKRDIPIRFDPRFRYCEDHEFALRMAAAYGCYYSPLRLTRLDEPQMLGKGLSGNIWAMRKGELFMYCKLWRIHWFLLPLIPLLLFWSLAKHVWRWISIRSGRERRRRKNRQ